MSPDHLLPLDDGEFAVWRAICIRRAGLPFEWVTDPGTVHEPAFQEALAWQHPLVGRLARKGSPDRGMRRAMAAYQARYCAKNDTIGYFGPTAWGRWSDGDTEIPPLPATVRGPVFFELWAMQAVAEALEQRHGLQDWVVPHLASAVARAPGGVRMGDGSLAPLSDPALRVVEAVDGFRTVVDVAAEVADDAYTVDRATVDIRRLQARGVLTRGFHLPQTRAPERVLAMHLARVADPGRREAAQRDLASLVAARDEVARRLGDAAAVAAAIEALQERFTEMTAQDARRRDGEYYAGRSVVYEDCYSPFDPALGADIRAAVGPVLALLLRSARWLSRQVAAGHLAAARDIVGSGTGDGYPLARLLERMEPTIRDSTTGPTADAVRELRRRWTQILLPDNATGPVTHTVDSLRDKVHSAFAADAPGWPSARWHSPDLMLAAASADDLRAGRWLAVLGEMHPTINTVDQLVLSSAYPDQRSLRRWIDADMPSRIVPLYPVSGGMVNSRTAPPEAYHSPHYTYLGTTPEPSYAPRSATVVPVGGLRVHRDGDALVVRAADGGFTASLTEVLDDYLALSVFNRFGLLDTAGHTPRVTVDRVVVSRERWQFPLADVANLGQARLARATAYLRGLAADLGLPAVAFWVIAGEVKPMYVDLADDLLLDALWSKLRRGRTRHPDGMVSVSEMLPGPDQLWLRDERGRRYTTEFRLTCVDSQAYPAAEGK